MNTQNINTLFGNVNKPLKCIVTNNTNTINYLKDSGSFIVLDQSDIIPELNGTDYREIYLGDCFLAGGYGVYSKTQQEQLIGIIKTFQDTIDRLDDTDLNLDQIISIKYQELENKKLDKSYQNENGINTQANASNTYIEFVNSDNTAYIIKTSDILQLIAYLPTYENFEILDISYNVTVIDNENRESTYTNTKVLPINTYIKNVAVDITLNLHDCGNITNISVEYLTTNSSNTTSYEVINYTASNVVHNNSFDNIETHIRINKSYDVYPLFVKEGNNDIIKSITINIDETPESKYKTIEGVTDLQTDELIKYSYNAIPKQEKTIQMPSLIGKYFLAYYTSTELSQQIQAVNIIQNLVYVEINEDLTTIPLSQGTKIVLITVPINYKIYDITLHGQNTVNITNFVNYYPYNNSNIIINKLNSSLYALYFSQSLNNNSKLNIYLKKMGLTYNDIFNDGLEHNIKNMLTVTTDSTNPQYILNGEYISHYWIDTNQATTYKNNQLQYINSLNYKNL